MPAKGKELRLADAALARMNRPRPAMTCLRAGVSYSDSPAIRIIDCNNSEFKQKKWDKMNYFSIGRRRHRRRPAAALPPTPRAAAVNR